MIQFENFSDKAKQVIEFIKNCKHKDVILRCGTYSKTVYINSLISYSCSLFNIWPEYDNVLEFCKSKNYWMDSK